MQQDQQQQNEKKKWKSSCDNDRLCQHLTCLPRDYAEKQTERETDEMDESKWTAKEMFKEQRINRTSERKKNRIVGNKFKKKK